MGLRCENSAAPHYEGGAVMDSRAEVQEVGMPVTGGALIVVIVAALVFGAATSKPAKKVGHAVKVSVVAPVKAIGHVFHHHHKHGADEAAPGKPRR